MKHLVLRAVDLSVGYGSRIVIESINLRLYRKQILHVQGINGSGKTTLLDTLSGDRALLSGSVNISERRRGEKCRLVRLYQKEGVFQNLTVSENILLAKLNGSTKLLCKGRNAKIEIGSALVLKLLEASGVLDSPRRSAYRLSYGQRRTVGLAMVLEREADIFLLDEPFAGLGKNLCPIVLEAILRKAEEGAAIVVVEHRGEIMAKIRTHHVQISGRVLVDDSNGEK